MNQKRPTRIKKERSFFLYLRDVVMHDRHGTTNMSEETYMNPKRPTRIKRDITVVSFVVYKSLYARQICLEETYMNQKRYTCSLLLWRYTCSLLFVLCAALRGKYCPTNMSKKTMCIKRDGYESTKTAWIKRDLYELKKDIPVVSFWHVCCAASCGKKWHDAYVKRDLYK